MAWMSVVGTVPSTAAGNPHPSCPGWLGVDATFVLSVTPLHCAVVRLMLWEWLVALVGRDVPVEAAVTG